MEENQATINSFSEILKRLEKVSMKLEDTYKNKFTQVWLDSQEVCDLLKVTKRTIQIYRHNGFLPFSHIGGKVFFRKEDIDACLTKNYTKAGNKKR